RETNTPPHRDLMLPQLRLTLCGCAGRIQWECNGTDRKTISDTSVDKWIAALQNAKGADRRVAESPNRSSSHDCPVTELRLWWEYFSYLAPRLYNGATTHNRAKTA